MQASTPSIREIIYIAPQKDWKFPLHAHKDSAELSLLLQGGGDFYAGNQTWNVSEGMLIAKNAGLSHAEASDLESPMEQICIEVEQVHLEGLPENFVIPDWMSPVIPLDDEFSFASSAFRYLQQNYQDPDHSDLCSSILSAVFSLLQQKTVQQSRLKPSRKTTTDENISRLTAYLDQHYREKLRIRDLAKQFYMSEGHLSRQFKKKTGFTINDYIVSKRMGEAQRLLLFDRQSIKEIAALCGYEDVQYFYQVFRKTANCTPVEFREKYNTQKS